MQRMSSKDEQLLRASMLFDGQCHQIKQDDYSLLASDEVRTHLKQWSIIGSALRNELPGKIDPAFSSKVMARIEKIDPVSSHNEDKDELPSMLASKSAFRAGLASYARSKQQESNVGAYEQEQAVGAYETKSVGAYENKAVGAYENKAVGAYENKAVGAYEAEHAVANDIEDQPLEAMSEQVTHKSNSALKRFYIFASQVAIAASVALIAVVGLQTYNASGVVEEDNSYTTAYINSNPISGLSLAAYQNSDSDVLLQLNGQIPAYQDFDPNNESQVAQKNQQEQEIERINLYVKGYVFDTADNK